MAQYNRVTALGIDPGLNFTGYALVHADIGPEGMEHLAVERLGVIRPYRSSTPNTLDKVKVMMESVHDKIPKVGLDIADYNIVEFQQCYPKSKQQHYTNPNDLIRIGYVSAAAAVAAGLENTVFVLPRIWTKGKPKAQNHELIKAKFEQPYEAWHWDAKENNARARLDAMDAVGLAVWGLEQVAENMQKEFDTK